MTCARWKGALLAALASAGVAWGQSAAHPSAATQPAPRIVTVQEKAGLPERCRVLKTWTTEKGQTACLLETVDTEELLTVVQTAVASRGAKQVAVQIYRWSNSRWPPEGSPFPPPDAPVRQVSHVTESPGPDLTPVPVSVTTVPPATPSETSPIPACASGSCGKDNAHCCQVHHYEKPPSLYFVPGACAPVCTPDCLPGYGYYPTQWSRWPGGEAPVPATYLEEFGEPAGRHEMPPPVKASPPPGP